MKDKHGINTTLMNHLIAFIIGARLSFCRLID